MERDCVCVCVCECVYSGLASIVSNLTVSSDLYRRERERESERARECERARTRDCKRDAEE
jgi:hypothetical protein